jgi:YesN/AraC family two-component response regulator
MNRILLVDDEPFFNSALTEYLQINGFEVSSASNGNEAIRILNSVKKFDIVITDIIMPDKDGIELILYMKAKFPETKIIAISGGGRISPANYLYIASVFKVNGTILKPFSFHELEEKMNELTLATLQIPKKL